MLAKLGCSYVLVGHSERRQYHGEDDELVNAKVKALLAGRADADPVRRRGPGGARRQGEHLAHVLAQLDGGLAGLRAAQVAGMVIAYEPVWAIGTGEVATPEDAQEVCAAIRARISGGSRGRNGRWRAYPVRRIGQRGQHRCDHGSSRTSTARLSAVRAWMPVSSPGYAGTVKWPGITPERQGRERTREQP